LKVDGVEVTLPLEAMNVYVTDNHEYPEHFEVLGVGITLVGECPLETRVDYEERWDVLIGKAIALSPRGGHPGEPREASVTLPGRPPMAVVEGSFVARRVSGDRPGKEGDKTLSGDVTIHVQDASGRTGTLSGTFAVHCITWG
jgi:hypothetical protein